MVTLRSQPGNPAGLHRGRVNRETISVPESERSDENGMVILSRVDACAPPYPTMYTGSGDVKQKRRARRPEGEEWSEAGIRNLRQQVKYALRFFVVETALHQNPKHLSLSPPSRTAASASSQAGQSNKTKETFNNRRTCFASLFEPCSWLEPSVRTRCRETLTEKAVRNISNTNTICV